MGIFTDLPALIGDLITDLNTDEGLGFSVTYTSITPGAYDPATGTTAAATTSAQTGVIAIEETFSQKELVAGLVQANDMAIAIPANNLTASPKPTDTVTIDTVVWSVVRLRDIKPGSASVLHSLHLRRA